MRAGARRCAARERLAEPCRRPLLGLPDEDLACVRVLVDDLELTPANA